MVVIQQEQIQTPEKKGVQPPAKKYYDIKKRIEDQQKKEIPAQKETDLKPKPVANLLVAEKYSQDTGVSRLVMQTVHPPRGPPQFLMEAKERVDTGISGIVQRTVRRPTPSNEPFIRNQEGVIIDANPDYIPSGKVRDLVTGVPISPVDYGGYSYLERQRLINLQMQSMAEKRLTSPDTFRFSTPWGAWDTGIRQPDWMSRFNISMVSVYDRQEAERMVDQMIHSGQDIWQQFGSRTRMTQSYAQAGLHAVTWPVTLPQAVIKLTTGRTWILPDVAKKLTETRVRDQPSGLIGTGIEEGLGYATGEKTDAFKRYLRDPWSGAAATFGEIHGFQIGGAAVHATKVGMIRGLGHVRSGLTSLTGWNIPGYTQITYYFPHRIIRRWVVKKIGRTDIETAMGRAMHSPDTLTDRGLSFAKGKTPGERITWTVQQTGKTSDLPFSQGDYLISSASGQRLGFSYVIKGKSLHELPSMSYTPYGFTPTRFYRFEPSGLSYSSSFSLLPKRWSPTGIVTRLHRLYGPPRGSYDDITQWALKQPKGSWGTIGPKMLKGGPETEINVYGSKLLDIFNKSVLKRYLPDPGKASWMQRLFGYQYYSKVPLEGGLTEFVPVKFTYLKGTGLPKGVRLFLPKSTKMVIDTPTISAVSPSTMFARGFFSYPSYKETGWSSVSGSSTPSVWSYSYPSSPSLSRVSSPSSPSIPSVFSSPSYPSRSSSPSRPSYPSYPSASSKASSSLIRSLSSASSSSLPPPPPPLMGFGVKGKKKKTIRYDVGYRIRRWKTPTLSQLLKGGP